VPENARPVVLSVAKFTSVETMDGGDTLAVRFKALDGREIALLVPQQGIADLQAQITESVRIARQRRSARQP
jgi:hypothetical protein